jgi:hypothetical protein
MFTRVSPDRRALGQRPLHLPGMTSQRTLYCGNRHRTLDGVPLAHSCRVLAPEYLEAERREEYGRAASLLERMPLILHAGVAEAHPGDPLRARRVAVGG